MADLIDLSGELITGPLSEVRLYEVPNQATKVVQALINASWGQAQLTKEEYKTKVEEAFADFLDIVNAPHITAGSVTVPTITAPNIDIPASITVDDLWDQFETKYLEIAAWLDGKYTSFRTTHFPDEQNAYAACEDALQAALANPAVNLPPALVAQVIGDDQARILSDKVRAQDAVVAQFAARGFPLPPDVAASAVLQIEQKAQDELAESSRKIAMTAIENWRFTVTNLLDLRKIALSATADYVKAIASGPELASKMTNVGWDAQIRLISAGAAWYNADAQAKETMSKVAQYNNSATLDAAVKNQDSDKFMIESKLRAMLEEARIIGQQLVGYVNNLHVGASISSNGGTTISSSGEY